MTTDYTDTAKSQAQAQYETIVAMLAAVNCDYSRLEELKELHDTTRYVAGWNMPGYMPDSTPAEFDSADDAREYIANEIESLAGMTDDSAEITRLTSCADNIRSGSGEYGETIGQYHYFISQDGTMLPDADVSEFEELTEAAGDCEDEDDARQRIQEDALSVEIRSDWVSPGEIMTAGEFQILLCTGGPAVRIMGELSEHGEPSRAWLEYQDWGTPWTQYFDADSSTLCAYASNFLGG